MKVGEIKQIIKRDHDLYEANFKLFAVGMILDNDDKTAQECSLNDGAFLVVKGMKVKEDQEPSPQPVPVVKP